MRSLAIGATRQPCGQGMPVGRWPGGLLRPLRVGGSFFQLRISVLKGMKEILSFLVAVTMKQVTNGLPSWCCLPTGGRHYLAALIWQGLA